MIFNIINQFLFFDYVILKIKFLQIVNEIYHVYFTVIHIGII